MPSKQQPTITNAQVALITKSTLANMAEAQATTVTRLQRANPIFAARFERKDARTEALRLTYGTQSNKSSEVTLPTSQDELRMTDEESFKANRWGVQHALRATGWDDQRKAQIMRDFDRLRQPKGRTSSTESQTSASVVEA